MDNKYQIKKITMDSIELEHYDTHNFLEQLKEFHICLSEIQLKQLICYYELLIEWNHAINLTSITDFQEVLQKHFLDSVSLIKAIDLNQDMSLIDVGTGAGFPGIPLKIVFPNIKVMLLDSLNKRILFLNEVIECLGLEEIEAIHGRAEDIAKNSLYREQFDICVSRAVANMTTLSEYCIPFVKMNGVFVSYKSEKINEESKAAMKGIQILGGNYKNQIEFYLPGSDIYRNLFTIEKIKNTPKKYPRKAGLPSKEPLN